MPESARDTMQAVMTSLWEKYQTANSKRSIGNYLLGLDPYETVLMTYAQLNTLERYRADVEGGSMALDTWLDMAKSTDDVLNTILGYESTWTWSKVARKTAEDASQNLLDMGKVALYIAAGVAAIYLLAVFGPRRQGA